jgi:WD40 repeat protein
MRSDGSELGAQLVKEIHPGPNSGGDRRAKLWILATHREVASYEHESGVIYAAFSADGNTLVTTDAGQTIRLWRAPSWGQIASAESLK